MKKLLFIALIVAAVSCKQEEDPLVVTGVVDVIDTNNVPIDTSGVPLDSNHVPVVDKNPKIADLEFKQGYTNQMYFNLEGNQVISENDKFSWDFMFQTSGEANSVKLNSSIYMGAAFVQGKAFEEISFGETVTWQFEDASGQKGLEVLDITKDGVYLVFGGYDFDGVQLSNIKLQITNMPTSYQVKCQRKSGEIKYYEVSKNSESPWVHLSVSDGLMQLMPTTYDFLFTQYMDVLEGGTNYLVTGVLFNTSVSGIKLAQTDGLVFDLLKIDDVLTLDFSSDEDEIGYDWKTYDGTYSIVENRNYIIKKVVSGNEEFYKLRFLAFKKNIIGGRDVIFEYARL